MYFDDFDQALVKQLTGAMHRGEDHVFHDPRYPYRAILKREGEIYVVVIEDTRKRWFGRVLDKRRVTDKHVSGSSTQGPAFQALMMVQHWIDDDRQRAAQKEALTKKR